MSDLIDGALHASPTLRALFLVAVLTNRHSTLTYCDDVQALMEKYGIGAEDAYGIPRAMTPRDRPQSSCGRSCGFQKVAPSGLRLWLQHAACNIGHSFMNSPAHTLLCGDHASAGVQRCDTVGHTDVHTYTKTASVAPCSGDPSCTSLVRLVWNYTQSLIPAWMRFGRRQCAPSQLPASTAASLRYQSRAVQTCSVSSDVEPDCAECTYCPRQSTESTSSSSTAVSGGEVAIKQEVPRSPLATLDLLSCEKDFVLTPQSDDIVPQSAGAFIENESCSGGDTSACGFDSHEANDNTENCQVEAASPEHGSARESCQPACPSPSSDAAAPLSQLSDGGATYTLDGVIGRGAFGRVLAATTQDGVRVAIKVVHKMKMYRHVWGRERLLQEKYVLELAAKNERQFLTYLLASWEDEDNVYFVMDMYYENLRSRLTSGPDISPAETKLCCAEMLFGLAELHHERTMHRDIKPDNFLIDADGHIVLCDFGFSHTPAQEEDFEESTFYGRFGTAGYLAPEMIAGTNYTYKADVYSLGLLFVEIFAGMEAPFYHVRDVKEQLAVMKERGLDGLEDIIEDPLQLDLVYTMLQTNADERPTVYQAMAHPYLEDIDWDCVRDRMYMHEYIPTPDRRELRREGTSLRFKTFHLGLDSKYASYDRDSTGKLLPNDVVLQQLKAGDAYDFVYPSA